MSCFKLPNYKQKLPRQWTLLCRKIKTSMGEWLVEYNGENRPVKFTQGTKSIEMKYDYMGRRIQYVYKTGNTLNKDRRYMYNGYTLVQEMYNTNQVYMEFTWDPTAGTATKPLMLAFPTEGKNLFYFHDANKNVTELAYRATHNGIGAHYEYDTFGNIITNTRNSLFNFDSNNINPFRFSSEYFDSELGLVYYNYRHYNPTSGRWLSRDPIAEKGGFNLYNFLLNDAMNYSDLVGLFGDGGGPFTRPGVSLPLVSPEDPRIIIHPPKIKGHGDFTGSNIFDFTAEDHDPETEPILHPNRHFQDSAISEQEVIVAIGGCNKHEFERAMHRLQDWWAHRYYNPITHTWEWVKGNDIDNNEEAWIEANKKTEDMVKKFMKNCCQNKNKEWIVKKKECKSK